jgi:hypothetical protein
MKGESRGVGRRLLDSEAQLAQERGESRESVVERLRWFINSHLLSIAMEPAPDIGPYDAVRHKAGENCKHCKAIADLETLNAVVEAAQELLQLEQAEAREAGLRDGCDDLRTLLEQAERERNKIAGENTELRIKRRQAEQRSKKLEKALEIAMSCVGNYAADSLLGEALAAVGINRHPEEDGDE